MDRPWQVRNLDDPMIGTSMKRILISLFVIAFAGTALAADIVMTVPDPAVPRIVELCQDLRLRLNIRVADWSNEVCATEAFRIGMREVDKRVETADVHAVTRTQVKDSLVVWDANFPRTPAAFCGDNTLDVEFGEQCDDGNRIGGDGCDRSCQTE
jgi:cysteine-rich repeat protein